MRIQIVHYLGNLRARLTENNILFIRKYLFYTSRRFWNHRATDRVTLVMFTIFERGFVSVFIFNCQLLKETISQNKNLNNNIRNRKIDNILVNKDDTARKKFY